ncbi:MAG: hypothetical protein ACTSWR_05050 [Candidatus Helarchaeota archaeon]
MIQEIHYTCPKCGMFVAITIKVHNVGVDGQNQVKLLMPICSECNKKLIRIYSKSELKLIQ